MQKVEVGHKYYTLNGNKYEVVREWDKPGDYTLRRIKDGLEFLAHGTRIERYGVINWNYATEYRRKVS